MSTQVVSTDNATVFIQINPQVVQDSAGGEDKRGPYHNAVPKGFLKVQPKALGTVQIITGVVMFLFGIVLTINIHDFNITIHSGVTRWGSLIYITAGCLSVAAENKLHPCLVKASLGMNVVSAVTAGIAIFLLSAQLLLIEMCFYPYSDGFCSDIKVLGQGIVIVLMVFSVLQFIISICISAFACKATCATDSSVVNVSLNQMTIN